MGSVKSLVLAGAAAFVMIPGAFAADLAPLAPPMMPPRVQAPVEECCGGWYLRGDIGVGVIRNVKWFDADNAAVGGSFVQQANADTTFIGTAGNKVTGLTDLGAFSSGAVGGFGFADDATKWNLAWAIHAGVAYNVSNNLKLEFAYRFLHLGDAVSGTLHCGNGCTSAPVEIRNIESHDFKFGMRWPLN